MVQFHTLKCFSSIYPQFSKQLILTSCVRKCSSQVLQEHSLKVPSFGGSLWIKSNYNVHVLPTNTMDYPNLDQAFVKVSSQ